MGMIERFKEYAAALEEACLDGDWSRLAPYFAQNATYRSYYGADLEVTGRDAVLKGVPPEMLEEYERLFAVRDGLAVCAVESQFCQGCYTNITMNDLVKLSGGRLVVQCGSCQRILYLSE